MVGVPVFLCAALGVLWWWALGAWLRWVGSHWRWRWAVVCPGAVRRRGGLEVVARCVAVELGLAFDGDVGGWDERSLADAFAVAGGALPCSFGGEVVGPPREGAALEGAVFVERAATPSLAAAECLRFGGGAVEEDAVVAVFGFDFVERSADGGVVGVVVVEVLVGDAEALGDAFAFLACEGDDARGSGAAVAAHGALEAEAFGEPLALFGCGAAAHAVWLSAARLAVRGLVCVSVVLAGWWSTRTATMVWSSSRVRRPVCS